METASLAAKQKRANDWSAFIAEGGVQDPTLRQTFEARLTTFRAVLKRVWEAGTVSSTDAAEIADLERQLTQLDEEARVRVVGRRSANGGASCSG